MRTTIRIEDALYREVKSRAARQGRTVGAVLEDAVRIGLSPPDDGRAPFVITAGGRGGLRPGVDLSSNAAVLEALDDGQPLDALR